MAKRQGADLSDSEPEGSPPKRLRRPRLQGSDDEDIEYSQPQATNTNTNGNGDTSGAVDISDDSDMDDIADGLQFMDGEDSEEIDEEMAKQQLEKIRAELQANIKKSGVRGTLKQTS